MHQWAPEANKAKAAYIDKRKDTFACAIGAKPATAEVPQEEENKDEAGGSGVKNDFKAEIIGELSKLMSIYKAAGPTEKGKVMGYQRAIANIQAYKKPITSAEQMDEIPYVGEGIKKKVKE